MRCFKELSIYKPLFVHINSTLVLTLKCEGVVIRNFDGAAGSVV